MGIRDLRPFFRSFSRLYRSTSTNQEAHRHHHHQHGYRQMSSSTSAILYAATVAVPKFPSARPDTETTTKKAHHKSSGGFENPWPSYKHVPLSELGSQFLKRRWSGENKVPDVSNTGISVQKPDFLLTRETPKLRATWLGHASFLVEFPGGLRVLFDPVFEKRCSPFSFMG